MASLIKNLLGNGSNDRELPDEIRTLLREVRSECDRYEALVRSANFASDRLQQLSEPVAKAAGDMDAIVTRLADLENRNQAVTELANSVQGLSERADALLQSHEQAEKRIAGTVEDSRRIREIMEDLGRKAELADSLKTQLASFLEVEKPFQQMRGEAEGVRGTVEAAGEQMGRLTEQQNRLSDHHKTALSKMEALDRRRDELGRDLQDKERRVTSVEMAVRGMDGLGHTLEDIRREIGTLKASADLLAQKSASLEGQRETVDRALARAENLDRAMNQIDEGVRQQQENEKALGALQERVDGVRALHEEVVGRCEAISRLQREVDDRTQATRQDLAAVTEETKKSIERFDFERRGIESVTQRVADLRGVVADAEGRFKGIGEQSALVVDLQNQSQSIASHLRALAGDCARVDQEIAKLPPLRSELDETMLRSREAAEQLARIESSRPAVEAALGDLTQLRSAQGAVKEALEQSQHAHAEIARMRENQAESRTWMAGIEQSVSDLGQRSGQVLAMAPTLEFVEKQTQRIGESMSAVESRREMVEDLQRRLTQLEALHGELDDREQQLGKRMEVGERQFAGLLERAEEAEQMTMTVAGVASTLKGARHEADEIKKAVAGIAQRAESVESLAEQTKALQQELKQRQKSLAEATRELEQVSAVRQQAADTAQQLEETHQGLAATLGKTEQSAAKADEHAATLEARVAKLAAVEKRLTGFDERLSKWNKVDQDVSRSLEEIVSRQSTVEALKADLDRMFEMAEKTADNVRAITSAHQELAESRELLNDVTGRLKEMRESASELDERKHQLNKAEDRLARAEGLLQDVQSSFQILEKQKGFVDQAVERTASLQFLLKQAEAAIAGLKEQRKGGSKVRAVAASREDEGEEEPRAKAA